MISMIWPCSSIVILLSEGRHNPLSKISIPASNVLPSRYAFVLALPIPSLVMKGFILNTGCMCIGFQIGLPSALYFVNSSNISVGQVLPASLINSAYCSLLTCLHIASLSIIKQDNQKFGSLFSSS